MLQISPINLRLRPRSLLRLEIALGSGPLSHPPATTSIISPCGAATAPSPTPSSFSLDHFSSYREWLLVS